MATMQFLQDLDISVDKGRFICKMFEKLDGFSFHIARMSSIVNDIPSIIFYGSTTAEFVRLFLLLLRFSILLLKNILPVAKNLPDRMINQDGSKQMFLK